LIYHTHHLYVSSQAITSVRTLITLLKNEKLILNSENTAFTLVHLWLESRGGWTVQEKQQAYDEIMDSDALRFHHMDPHYMTAFAFRTPWMLSDKTGRSAAMLHLSLMFSQGFVRFQPGVTVSTTRAHHIKDHHPSSSFFRIKITREMCSSLLVADNNQSICAFMGLVRGIPFFIMIRRNGGGEEARPRAFGLYVGWSTDGLCHSDAWQATMKYSITAFAMGGRQRRHTQEMDAEENVGWGK